MDVASNSSIEELELRRQTLLAQLQEDNEDKGKSLTLFYYWFSILKKIDIEHEIVINGHNIYIYIRIHARIN